MLDFTKAREMLSGIQEDRICPESRLVLRNNLVWLSILEDREEDFPGLKAEVEQLMNMKRNSFSLLGTYYCLLVVMGKLEEAENFWQKNKILEKTKLPNVKYLHRFFRGYCCYLQNKFDMASELLRIPARKIDFYPDEEYLMQRLREKAGGFAGLNR